MKIFSTALIKQWEQEIIAKHYKNSAELMEAAADNCIPSLQKFALSGVYHIVCGIGNNGGDGLCIARMLALEKLPVKVLIVGKSEDGTADFKKNLERLIETNISVSFLDENNFTFYLELLDGCVVDCLFGIGLNRPVEGWLAEAIAHINRSAHFIVSIDTPSGLLADSLEEQSGAIVEADITLTFQQPKPSFFFKENHKYVGEFRVLHLWFSEEFEASHSSDLQYYDRKDASHQVKGRDKYVYKGQLGHARIIAGSKGKIGAAVLCAKAAYKAGTGLVTVHVPQVGYTILQTALPEAMCETDEGMDYLSSAEFDSSFSATAIGPGIGTAPETVLMLRRILKQAEEPLVLDADALNIIAQKHLLADVPKMSILTPHVGEFDRLFGEHNNSFERLKTLRQKTKELDLIIVLKGPHTAVATPDRQLSFNASGGPELAVAGSGDLLTGVITSLLAQGYAPETAARLGVFLHGASADEMYSFSSPIGHLAGDLITNLPNAYFRILHTQGKIEHYRKEDFEDKYFSE